MPSESKTTKPNFGDDILAADHVRGCRGREYDCSCGYDDAKDGDIIRMRRNLEVRDSFIVGKGLWDEFVRGLP